jgi:2-(1,2-epoxy-1,2-dihydrophenyl)acetyl-CoA isomerase
MSTYQFLNIDIRNQIAYITLHRPDAANSFHIPMAQEFMRAAIACDEDQSIRAVLITGSGKMFCAGGDIASFATAGDAIGEYVKEITTYLHAAVSRFARMNAPIIVAVNGAAAGAGFSIVASADLVIAAESAKFTMAYTAIGASPDGSASYFLPRLIGLRRTQELMLTNRRLTAKEAYDWGLITQVVTDDQLMTTAETLATQIANGPTPAFGSIKRLLQTTYGNGLETQMELETRNIADNLNTADGKEGIKAFLEKRAAVFKGM